MIRKLIAAAAVLGVALFLSLAQAGEEKGITITNVDDKGKEQADGGKIKLAKGATLTVKLPGNATTGFSWQIEKNDKEALEPQGKYEYIPAKKGAIGGGGTFIYNLKALKAGATDLEFAYKRVFEKGKEPAKTFKVKVEVE